MTLRLPLLTLALVPAYVLRKVPLYLAFMLRRRQRSWVRTERRPEASSTLDPPVMSGSAAGPPANVL